MSKIFIMIDLYSNPILVVKIILFNAAQIFGTPNLYTKNGLKLDFSRTIKSIIKQSFQPLL